ncbi:hypothetical protein TRVL_10062 [Trypanosoma vivax]|nr:hypothetical protein TRVL_10062 [Trypanosoma vivax]
MHFCIACDAPLSSKTKLTCDRFELLLTVSLCDIKIEKAVHRCLDEVVCRAAVRGARVKHFSAFTSNNFYGPPTAPVFRTRFLIFAVAAFQLPLVGQRRLKGNKNRIWDPQANSNSPSYFVGVCARYEGR